MTWPAVSAANETPGFAAVSAGTVTPFWVAMTAAVSVRDDAPTYRQVVPDAREQRCGSWHRVDHAQRPLDRVIESNAPAWVVLFVVVGGGVELDTCFAAELDRCHGRARNRRRPSSSTDSAGTPGVG